MYRVRILGSGTSQGVPVIGCKCEVCRSEDSRDKRLRSSVMIEIDHTTLIIDTGPDFRYQMLREGVENIDAILYTHHHKDHTGGLDDVRAFNYTKKSAIDIYGSKESLEVIRKDFDYAFATEPYPGVPVLSTHTISTTPFVVNGVEIVPIVGRHYLMDVTGYRIGGLCYMTDFNSIEQSEIDKIKGVEVLIINALRHEKHLSHFTVEEALAVAKRVGAKRTYLTHMSHQIGLHTELAEQLPEGIFPAYDRLKIDIYND